MEDIRKSIGYLCRNYVDIQHLRIAEQLRLNKLLKSGEEPPEDIVNTLVTHIRVLQSEEKAIVNEVKKYIKSAELFKFCKRVRGLGVVSAMEFLGYVDIYKATSAGKIKAYAGIIPGGRFEKGKNLKINPEVKGKFWLFARNVVMKKDDYYYPLYRAKKEYYLKMRQFEKFAENPETCPNYEECKEKLENKAKRMGREPKNPPCRAHAEGMAKFWLASLIVSHMWEITRKEYGLQVSRHRMHIPPKPVSEAHKRAVLKVVVPCLEKGEVLEVDLSDEHTTIKLAKALNSEQFLQV